MHGDDVPGARDPRSGRSDPCASTRPSHAGIVSAIDLRVVGLDGNEELGEVEDDEGRDGDDEDRERAT